MPTYAQPRRRSLRATAPQAYAQLATRAESGWLLPALVAVCAAAMFAVHLGHSSLFIDEVYSWRASRGSLGDLVDALRYTEVTPPLYYLLLHAWIALTGSDSETILRLPSMLAGVALVGAVHWLGCVVAGRAAGLIAAALTAISPFVLVYSQQVRAYVWVMLAVTVAVAAVLQATRDRSLRMLVVAMIAALLAVLLHYTSLLVLAPVAVWLWSRPQVDVRWRLAFAAAIALPLAALAPLALEQLHQGHHDATATYASLTTFNALRIAGTPFDGRATGALTLWRELGAIVVIDALALLAFAEGLRGVRARRLLVICGLLPLAVVCLISIAGQPMALTRYTAVAAPFIIVAIGVVAAHSHRLVTAGLVAGAIVASGASLVAAERAGGQNPDTRAALATVAANWTRGDAVAGIGLLGFDGALSYYGDRLLPPGSRDVLAFGTLDEAVAAPQLFTAAEAGRSLWFVADPPMSTRQLRRVLGRLDYRPARAIVFAGNAPVQLIRAARIPERRRAGA